MNTITTDHQISEALKKDKYAVVSGTQFSIAPALLKDLNDLQVSWDDLEADKYLKDAATFRERRFGLFYFLPSAGDLVQLPQDAYFQSVEVNTYAGGVNRDFAPLRQATFDNPFLHSLIKFNFRNFPVESESTEQTWEIDVHQFRIIGTKGEAGEPTPEGVHHDGDEFNAIHLMQRTNVKGGVNSIHNNDKELIASATLSALMDSVYVWDPYVMHGVTPISPNDLQHPALRDVMVIGYNHKPGMDRPA